MTLAVNIEQRLGDFIIAAKFETTGSLTALFGASGAGKSSIINMVAGLSTPAQGRIQVGNRVLFDSESDINVPAHRRGIGYVFQEARLFPHLSVRQNLNYGKWFAARSDNAPHTDHIIALLGLAPLLSRMPGTLSGGEKQRVAIGRALFSNPQLLLMDEPIASLDNARRAEILPYIETLRDEMRVPIIYVSHSVAEVSRLASDIVVIADGKVAAAGPAAGILQRAEFLPLDERGETGSLVEMVIAAYDPDFDMTLTQAPLGQIYIPGKIGEIGKPVRLRLRARDIMIATAQPKGLSALNILHGSISQLHDAGAMTEVKVDCAGTPVLARITRQSAAALKLRLKMRVHAVIKTASLDGTGGVKGA